MSRTKSIDMNKKVKVVINEESSQERQGKEEIEENDVYESTFSIDIEPDGFYLPALFNKTKTGKIMEWRIWAINDLVYQTNGFIGGKMKNPIPRKIEQLKRKNAVSVDEQAILYAERCWIKQLDKGYKPSGNNKSAMDKYNRALKEKALQGGNNTGLTFSSKKAEPKKATVNKNKDKPIPLKVANILKEYTPMKAQKLTERVNFFITSPEKREEIITDIALKLKKKKKNADPEEEFKDSYFDATDGFYIQPKLDGWRCIIRLQPKTDLSEDADKDDIDNYDVVMTTQNNKQYPWFSHIKEEYKKFIKGNGPDREDYLDLVVDCEVYSHSMIIDGKEIDRDDRFSIIQSCCGLSRKEPHPNEDQIQVHIFDIVDFSLNQEERFELLASLFKKYKGTAGGTHTGNIIQRVATYKVESEKDIYEYHDKFFEQDYEGVMIRAKYMMYSQDRSSHLLKYKEFIDCEVPIMGATESKGTESGAILWLCQWPSSGKIFSCRQRGTIENRREIYKKYYKKYGDKLKNTKLGYLTIRYQQLTIDGSLPRFPVGISRREDMDF